MNFIYTVVGSEDGTIGAFLTQEAAIEAGIDYVEQNGDTRAVIDMTSDYVVLIDREDDGYGSATIYKFDTNFNYQRGEFRKAKDAKATLRGRPIKRA